MISTLILLAFVGFAILNSGVSLNYEVDEPKAMFPERAAIIEEKGKYIREIIFWLEILFWYLIATSVFLIAFVAKKKKTL